MNKKHTIGNITAVIMLLFAVAVDALQGLLALSVLFIPLSWMLSVMSIFGISLWFAIMGVKYLKDGGKKLLLMLAAGAVEFIPAINALPAVTASVLGTIVMTRIEDARRAMGKNVSSPRTAFAAGRLAQMRARREQAAGGPGPRAPGGVARLAGTAVKVVPAARAATTVARVAGAAARTPRPANDNHPAQEERRAA